MESSRDISSMIKLELGFVASDERSNTRQLHLQTTTLTKNNTTKWDIYKIYNISAHKSKLWGMQQTFT
jgi:benzoyl-CoA reductase/2-hydroxyglutaryl-CoA dehydratase subunit BcrC/BadD/HgdB